MPTTLRINITREVLGKTKDCDSKKNPTTNCAIAYAVRQIWPRAYVGMNFIATTDFGANIMHNQSKFIGRFDTATPAERAAMQPFSFDIDVPDEVINEINIDEVRRICQGSRTLELV